LPASAIIKDIKKDQLKIAVLERHKKLGNISVAVIKGLNLKKGAIATTVAHDSHNLIVFGTNEEDMVAAVREIKSMQVGIVIIDQGGIMASLTLEIAGLITSRSAKEVISDLGRLQGAIGQIALECTFNPFLAGSLYA
jgi:adenine deaminase